MSELEHFLGRVKWFNNKSGYGFITITDGPRSGSDIFVHHSAITVENQQYKYLVQGEYVEFDLVKTESASHEWQASHVVGIRGGKLMCETRNDARNARNEYRNTRTEENAPVPAPRQRNSKNTNVERKPRNANNADENKDWSLVDNKKARRPKKN